MSLTIEINGKPCECEPGEFLLEVARRNKFLIPSLCHHDGLPGRGCCRVCVVEAEARGRRDIVTSCVYPIERECKIYTDSERVKRLRKMTLALLRASAPESDRIARLCRMYGVPPYERFQTKPDEKCVLCGLCAKACENLGTGAISTVNRGMDKAVSTPYGEPSAVCVGCGSCASVCPTGAIKYEENVLEGGFTARKIWGKTFKLISCERCGRIVGTPEELRRAADKAQPASDPDGKGPAPIYGESTPASKSEEPFETPSPDGAGSAAETGKNAVLCDECKKKTMADKLAVIFGRQA